jgi:AcrR family transcriptional regulator
MPRSPARDRLVRTAADLFYAQGYARVGVNEVTDRAGVARMTLYNNFKSKEALALAAFEAEAARRREMITERLAAADAPLDRVIALFDLAETLAAAPGFRGCAFLNLAAQELSPDGALHRLVRAHKSWIRERFRAIAAEAGCADPERAARQLLALWDGGLSDAFVEGDVAPIAAARDAARLIAATWR